MANSLSPQAVKVDRAKQLTEYLRTIDARDYQHVIQVLLAHVYMRPCWGEPRGICELV
jgi:hypothetical protein